MCGCLRTHGRPRADSTGSNGDRGGSKVPSTDEQERTKGVLVGLTGYYKKNHSRVFCNICLVAWHVEDVLSREDLIDDGTRMPGN